MPTVDLHAHVVVPDAVHRMRAAHPDYAPTLCREDAWTIRIPGHAPMSPVPQGMFDTQVRLDDMDRRRVDLQLLSVPPPHFFYQVPPAVGAEFAAVQNDAMIEVSHRHPERLHVLATLPLQDPPAATREISRVAHHRLIRGVEIGTNVNGRPLDAGEFEPVWAALEDADLPVWLHPDQRTIAGADRLTSYYL
ncbi:MAG TPA: amidohydrolase family protein, partial [Jiangellales bacterium]|nr:amidohydrolase family protein [Jiangellales bacterium]